MTRRYLSLALLLVPVGAKAFSYGWIKKPGVKPASYSQTLDRHGSTWDNGVATIHLSWNGTAMVDLLGKNEWDMVGTVPQDTTNGAWYPGGIASGATMAGAGAFSASNYHRSKLQPGPLALAPADYPDGFTACVRITLNNTGTQRFFYTPNWSFSEAGGYLNFYYTQGGTAYSFQNGGGQGGNVGFGPHVACASFEAATGKVHVNYDLMPEITSTQSGAWTPPTTGYSQIGTDATNHPFKGILHEVWVGPYRTDAQIRAMVRQAFGMVLPDGSTLTCGRTGTQIAPAPKPGGGSWLYTQNIPRLAYESETKYGLLSEPSSRHYVKASGSNPQTSQVTWTFPIGRYTGQCCGTGGTCTVVAVGLTSPDIAACSGVSASAACTICRFTVTAAGTGSVTTTSGVTTWDIHDLYDPIFPVSYTVSGTIISVLADNLTLTAPSGVNTKKALQVQITAAPTGSLPWSQAMAPALVAVGPVSDPGSSRLFVNKDGKLDWDTYDSGLMRKRVEATHGFTDGSVHTLVASTSAGVMGLTADATPIGDASGRGSGVVSAQTTIYLGSDNATLDTSSGTPIMETVGRDSSWSGYLRGLVISNTPSTVAATYTAPTTVRFGGVSDTHLGAGIGFTREARIMLDAWGTDFLTHNGDLGWEPTAVGVEVWALNYLASHLGGGPRAIVLGNHDIGTCAGPTPCVSKAEAHSVMPADAKQFLLPNLLYGSGDIAGIHVVVTDTEYANIGGTPAAGNTGTVYMPTAELDWLAADLAATSLPVVILTHRPMDPANPNVANSADFRAVVNANKSKIVAVINGHDHAPEFVTDATSGVKYVELSSESSQISSWTTHNGGTHYQLELDPAARTVRVGWWENDTAAGYLETHVESYSMPSP